MGKVSTFLVGLFVLGASQAVKGLHSMVENVEGTPVDYSLLIEYTSVGMYYLGAVIAGYALVAAMFAIIKHNYRKRKKLDQQEEQERRRRKRQEERGYPPTDQPVEGQPVNRQQRPQYPSQDQR